MTCPKCGLAWDVVWDALLEPPASQNYELARATLRRCYRVCGAAVSDYLRGR